MTLDSEENRSALQYLADLFADGYAATPATLEAGWPGEAFGQGKAAMVIEGNWIVGFLAENFPDLNWAVAEVPEGNAGRATYAFTVCYGVGVESSNPDAAWQAIDYLTGPEGAAAWTAAFNVMPARQSLREGWLADHPELEPFMNGAEYAHRWQFRPGFTDVIERVQRPVRTAHRRRHRRRRAGLVRDGGWRERAVRSDRRLPLSPRRRQQRWEARRQPRLPAANLARNRSIAGMALPGGCSPRPP